MDTGKGILKTSNANMANGLAPATGINIDLTRKVSDVIIVADKDYKIRIIGVPECTRPETIYYAEARVEFKDEKTGFWKVEAWETNCEWEPPVIVALEPPPRFRQ